MSLNMYLGEVQSQTQSMNAMCTATIQGMEQVINSIDAFVFDAVLQGQTYDSAKAYFAQTFRPLAQGIIYLCEELIRQNDAFPNDFQSKVASTDVIEQEILEQMRGIDQTKAGMEGISNVLPAMQAMMGIFDLMKQKLQEKLEHLREFNSTSSSNYDTALQLAASIARGLAEVQSGKGFSPASGTFSTQGLNMEWTGPIQTITEEKAREAEIEKELEEEMALEEQEANIPWYQKTGTAALEFLQGIPGFSQGFDIAIVENVFGLTPPVSDELENSTSYQAGKLTGHVLSGAWSIVEMFAGLTLIGGSNFLTLAAELVTVGGATPIAVPVNGVLTVAGATAAGHGGFVWYNTIQNGKDTIQKIQSSSSSGGSKGATNPNAIRNVGDDILDVMESNGGHTLEKHVSKSNEDLIKRAIQEDVDATSYTNKNTATKAVQENLRKNADEISKWLNEEKGGRKVFDVEHKYSIGKGVLEDKKQVMYNLNKSRVVLIRDSSSEVGFRILTSFPLP
ncbi:RNase A-like domain-containing protein [Bacillus sp. BP-3]|uniref:RNase A-like domain-containing protein n=1 Tax=Bacillus sp. BP-3 TaxID=3022773 RepID=UPI00232DF69B|nr:RNase A-like domain-containing protein [Bacillus sp. BP-3]MDC2864640.1 T7SS effector LXG polymorphic toxin [Bacillus sp. BP-3]